MLQHDSLGGKERVPTFRQNDTGPGMLGFGEFFGPGDDQNGQEGSSYGGRRGRRQALVTSENYSLCQVHWSNSRGDSNRMESVGEFCSKKGEPEQNRMEGKQVNKEGGREIEQFELFN